MNRILFGALPLFLCSLAFAQPDVNTPGTRSQRPAPVPQGVFFPDTPANAVRYFFNAASIADETALGLVVQGAPVEKFGPNEWGAAMRESLPIREIQQWKIDSITTDAQTENDATVSLTFHVEFLAGDPRNKPDFKEPRTATVPFRLHRDPGNKTLVGSGGKDVWRVVPPSIETMMNTGYNRLDPFQLVAALALHDPRILPALNQQKNMTSLKQLGLGIMQYLQDNDQKYAFDDAGYAVAIKGYMYTNRFFTILGTDGEKWHFNNNLSQKSLLSLAEPARTVLLYDGTAPSPDALNFRFDGRTLIGFADGHVKAFTKDQLNDLIWKP